MGNQERQMNLHNLLKQARLSFMEFWAARAPREQTILMAGAAIVVLALVHLLLVDPALSGREKLNRDLPALRQQVAELQALARQAALSGTASTALPAISRESIEAALARDGLTPQSVTLGGDVVQVKLASASFSGLLRWLEEAQKDMQLAVVDANIVALPQPDKVDAVLSLRQPGHE
jgi:general secretion pathway protein M